MDEAVHKPIMYPAVYMDSFGKLCFPLRVSTIKGMPIGSWFKTLRSTPKSQRYIYQKIGPELIQAVDMENLTTNTWSTLDMENLTTNTRWSTYHMIGMRYYIVEVSEDFHKTMSVV